MIYVGAISEIDTRRKNSWIEGSLHATRSSIEQEIVPGGGLSLFRAGEMLTKYRAEEAAEPTLPVAQLVGLAVVAEAIRRPFRRLVTNSGQSPDRVLIEIEQAKASLPG